MLLELNNPRSTFLTSKPAAGLKVVNYHVTVITPNLMTLKLEFTSTTAIYVEAPKLSHFHLFIYHLMGEFTIKSFENLKTLFLESTSVIRSLLINSVLTQTVENLSLTGHEWGVGDFKFTLQDLFCAFPNMTSLCFSPWSSSKFEVLYGPWDGNKGLKTFRGYLSVVDHSFTFPMIASVIEQCFISLVDVSLLFQCHIAPCVSRGFIDRCRARWPKVNWRWGMWGEGMEDCWITDDVPKSKSFKKCSKKLIPYLMK
ncbi:hypothetical protein Lser_V15G32890 [Lactuca serriola]